MNGIVTKLWDLDTIQIPQELLTLQVEEKKLDAEIQRLSLRYAAEIPAETAEAGGIVYCRGDQAAYPDGRAILLYTGTALPGAEAAAQAVLGKKQGDSFAAELMGKTVELTVEKILRRVPVEINDDLIASLGLEGVQTLDDYREYLRKKAEADQKLEKSKAITRLVMDEMTDRSEFQYDEADMEAYIQKMKEEYAAQGPVDEDMPPMSDEELRQAVILQTKQGWMVEAFCKERGLPVDEAAAREEADQMAEMSALMGEAAPDREELLTMARQNQCYTAFFDYVDKIITEKMGGSYGDC